VVTGGHLDFRRRHVPDADRHVCRDFAAAPPACWWRSGFAVSRLVVLAPHRRPDLRSADTDLGVQRLADDESLGLAGRRLAGAPQVAELRQFLGSLPASLPPGEYVQLRAAPLGGKLFVLAYRADGSAVRVDAAGRPAPLTQARVEQVLAAAAVPVAAFAALPDGDAYYYAHGAAVELPVFRAILADEQRTHLYISPATGSFRTVDRDGRRSRWLQDGLHGLDLPGLHSRPLWDFIVLLLLAGVTVSCITGSWMAMQRIRRDLGGEGR
jgi:hypothetical protein